MFNKINKIFIISSFSFLFFLSAASAQEQVKNSFNYENAELGVKITGPEGWYIIPADKMKEVFIDGQYDSANLKSVKETTKRSGILVSFFRPSFNSTITLTARPNSEQQNLKTPLDVAKAYIKDYELYGTNVKILKEASVVNTGKIEGAHFIFKRLEVKNSGGSEMTHSTYIFIKDNVIYNLILKDKTESFDNNKEAFEFALNSLAF